jgi:putative FmdB family regulatory protein
MPRYNYHCEECEEYFEVIHSMSGTQEECILCDSPEISRVMCIPNYITKVTKTGSTKAGALVEEYIKKNKESIREEKKKLKSQEYKNE